MNVHLLYDFWILDQLISISQGLKKIEPKNAPVSTITYIFYKEPGWGFTTQADWRDDPSHPRAKSSAGVSQLESCSSVPVALEVNEEPWGTQNPPCWSPKSHREYSTARLLRAHYSISSQAMQDHN